MINDLPLICHRSLCCSVPLYWNCNFSALKLEFLFIETEVPLCENEMKLPSYAAK